VSTEPPVGRHARLPDSRHVLVYERRLEGHHLDWLIYIASDLVGAGFRVSVAVNRNAVAWPRVAPRLERLDVTLVTAPAERGGELLSRSAKDIADTLSRSGAGQVFLTSLDEVASDWFRLAAIGRMPDRRLHGRMGGIYFRPRPLLSGRASPLLWLKRVGLRRFVRGGWFAQVLVLDEHLHRNAERMLPGAPFFFLPDPFPDDFRGSQPEARRALGLPADRKIFLFYGGPYRRKGLHLAVEAFSRLPAGHRAFLLCAGQQPPGSALGPALQLLVERGSAAVINRYVLPEEEKLCFAASDFVLLPYLRHFGSSGVLSRASGAGRPVIASDEQLIGRRVREHGLGLLFATGDSAGLRTAIDQATQLAASDVEALEAAALRFASSCTREQFRAALLAAVSTGTT
jgi:glycosyltransferase involved in cell wall biosynthesis